MTDRIRFAMIGVGNLHAKEYAESLLLMPEVEVVALYSADLGVAKTLVPPRLQQLTVYDDLAELLAQERPEAALITLPNASTPQAMVQVAEAGVHVFAEKPCARTASEFISAMKAIRTAGVQFATGYTRRVSPAGRAIKEVVDGGVLGRLVSVEARWITTSVGSRDPAHPMFSAERSGGGVLHWLGCHWLDFMRWSTSSDITEVAAIMDALSGESIDVEDTAALSLRFSNGMIGTLHCAYVIDKWPHQLFFGLRGTDGWVHWDYVGSKMEVRSARPEWAAGITRTMEYDTDAVGGYERGDGVAVLRQFIATFRNGARPAVALEDVLRVLEVLDAAHESSRTGRRVTLAGVNGAGSQA